MSFYLFLDSQALAEQCNERKIRYSWLGLGLGLCLTHQWLRPKSTQRVKHRVLHAQPLGDQIGHFQLQGDGWKTC